MQEQKKSVRKDTSKPRKGDNFKSIHGDPGMSMAVIAARKKQNAGKKEGAERG